MCWFKAVHRLRRWTNIKPTLMYYSVSHFLEQEERILMALTRAVGTTSSGHIAGTYLTAGRPGFILVLPLFAFVTPSTSRIALVCSRGTFLTLRVTRVRWVLARGTHSTTCAALCWHVTGSTKGTADDLYPSSIQTECTRGAKHTVHASLVASCRARVFCKTIKNHHII